MWVVGIIIQTIIYKRWAGLVIIHGKCLTECLTQSKQPVTTTSIFPMILGTKGEKNLMPSGHMENFIVEKKGISSKKNYIMLFYHHPFSSCGFSFVIKISKIDFCLLKPSSRNWSSRLCYGGRNSMEGRNIWPVSLGKIKEAFQQGKEENSKALGKGEK